MITINFNNAVDNASLQVGDIAYYVETQAVCNVDSFNDQQVGSDPIELGEITAINASSIIVDSNNPPPQDAFIMFMKNNVVNHGRLKGYYAQVKIRHVGVEPAELFAISSEVTESSK